MLSGPDGSPVKTEEKPPESDATTEAPVEKDIERPLLGIDNSGNLTLFIPLTKVGEVFARGFVDVCRTQVIQWYANQAQKRRDIANLAAKTGFQRFKDQLLRRK